MGKTTHRQGNGRLPPEQLIADERGAILFMTVIMLMVFLLLAGVGSDLARWYVAREQNQTAVDAAALAGSLNGKRYVTVKVRYGHWETECETRRDGTRHCKKVCVPDPPVKLTGPEKELVEKGGWKKGTCRDRFLGIEERWIEYPDNTEAVASAVFQYNAPQLLESSRGGGLKSTEVKAYDSGRYAPSVVAKSEGELKTFLLNLAGVDSLTVYNCGQAGTFYELISGGRRLGRSGAPEDGCK